MGIMRSVQASQAVTGMWSCVWGGRTAVWHTFIRPSNVGVSCGEVHPQGRG